MHLECFRQLCWVYRRPFQLQTEMLVSVIPRRTTFRQAASYDPLSRESVAQGEAPLAGLSQREKRRACS